MSTSVESRVLSLKFDSGSFESKANSVLGLLGKLGAALKLPGAGNGFASAQKAASSLNLSGIASGVENISSKFSLLGGVALGVLTQIGATAVTQGAKLVKSLTLQPAIDGFKEYETQMNAVQTILANTSHKGTNLQQVNATLDELNKYADKTIYNFSEMTKNIGTFTAAGLDLDTSAQSIKGIANLAALSGSNSQQASTAMYQLSQALAAGKVGLQDWNSVVNAGMGGKVFQDALIRTADAMGVNATAAVKAAGSFRESISAKGGGDTWLSADVLSKTLQQFTGDMTEAELVSEGFTKSQAKSIMQMAVTANDAATKVKTATQLVDTLKEAQGSGWAQTMKILVGDFEEAKQLFTGISDTLGGIINRQSEARNALLQSWKDMGGRDKLIADAGRVWENLGRIIAPIKEAFKEIFPPTTADTLLKITGAVGALADHLEISDTTAANLKSTFKGVFSIIDIGVEAVKGFAKGLVELFSGSEDTGASFLDFTAKVGDWITNVRDAIVEGDLFGKFFVGLADLIKGGVGSLGDIVKAVVDFVAALLDGTPSLDSFGDSLGSATGWLGKVKDKFAEISPVLAAVGDKIAGAFGKIKEYFGDFVDYVTNVFDGISLSDIVLAALGGAVVWNAKGLDNVFETVKSFFEDIGDAGGWKSLGTTLSDTLGAVTESLKTMQTTLKAATLVSIAVAVGVLAASLNTLSKIDGEGLAKGLGAMAGLFAELSLTMLALGKWMDPKSIGQMMALSASMVLMATAIRILADAMEELGGLSWEELIKGLIGLAGAMTAMVLAAKSMSADKGGLTKAAVGMIAMATAIRIMAEAVQAFGSMDLWSLAKGLGAVGIALVELSIFMKAAASTGFGPKEGAALMLVAAALNVLALAVLAFGSMDVWTLAKGLTSIALALTAVAGGMKLMPKNILSQSVALVAVAVALNMLALAVRGFGSMDLWTLAKGLGAMGAALVILAGGLGLMNGTLSGSAALLVASVALNALMIPLRVLGGMSLAEIAKSLLTLAGALTILAGGLIFMNGTLSGSAALLVASAALAVLAPVLERLGNMSLAEIGKSLLVLAGAFVVLGAAGLLLAPIAPGMIAVAGSVALLGGAVALAGAGVFLFGKGLQAVAVVLGPLLKALAGGIAELVKHLPALGVAAGKGFAGLVKTIAANIGPITMGLKDIVVNALKAVQELAPEFGKTFAALIKAGLSAITDSVSSVVKAVVVIGTRVLEAITILAPKVAEAVKAILLAVIDVISTVAPEAIAAFLDIIQAFLDAVLKALPDFVSTGADIIVSLLEGLAQETPKVVTAATDLIVAYINALTENLPRIVDAGVNLVTTLIKAIAEALLGQAAALLGFGGSVVKSVVSGITTTITSNLASVGSKAAELGKKVGSSVVSGVGGTISSITSKATAAGNAAVNGIGNAISAGVSTVSAKAKALGDSAGNALGGLATWLGTKGAAAAAGLVNGLVNGIVKATERVTAAVRALGNAAGNAISAMKSALGIKGSDAGKALGNGMATGISNSSWEPKSEARSLISDVSFAVSGQSYRMYAESYDVGVNVASGMAAGMSNNTWMVASAASAVASAAISAAQRALNIHSPSRKFAELGEFSVMGFAQGLLDHSESDKRSREMGYSAMAALKSAMGEVNTDASPLITPIVDLTEVKKSASTLGDLFTGQDVSLDSALQASASLTRSAYNVANSEPGKAIVQKVVNYTQNNTSPKALSETEIYRRTRNLLGTAQEVLAT